MRTYLCEWPSFIPTWFIQSRELLTPTRNYGANWGLASYNAAVRLLGILLFLGGGAAVAFTLRRTLESGRPKDVAYGLLSFLAVIIALLGLGLTFVPGLLG